MKVSVSSYSFQSAIRAGKLTQFETIAAAHELGIGAIEFTDILPCEGETQPETAKALAAEAARLDVKIVAYTVGANLFCTGEAAEKEVERLCRQVDIAAVLGAPLMRHDVCYKLTGEGNGRTFDTMLPVIAENARRVTAYAKTKGIRTCTENHGYIAQDSDRVERLCLAVNDENYGVLVDVGNFACVDEDSAAAVSRLAPLAFHVHAKDFIRHPFAEKFKGGFETRGCNRLEGCTIGDGQIPVEQCLAILRRAGYDGYVSIEFEGAGDCFTEIRRGKEKLLSYGLEE